MKIADCRLPIAFCVFLLTAHSSLLTASAQDTPLTNKFPASLNTEDSLGRTADRSSGTLSAGINSSATSFAITGDPSSYPASGIAVVIDSEIVLCTSRSSSTFSGCLRGQKGTSAAGHLTGAAVKSAILSAQRDVLVSDLLELEKKLGYGSAPASGATSGYCFRKNGDGTTGWSACPSGGGSGTVTGVTASAPLSSSGGTAPNLAIQNASADGATKGAAAFTASDFDSAGGIISIDYANAQAADVSHKGLLTAADWAAFNAKQASDGDLSAIGALSGTGFAKRTGVNVWALVTPVCADLSNAGVFCNRSEKTLTAGAGLTGGGDLSADRTFDVGAGAGITVNANDVALTTPGTLNVSSSNTSTGNHTHAVTTSANPGTTPAILASQAGSPQLTLPDFLATGNLFVRDTSTGFTSPGTTVVSPVANNAFRSTSFTSGLVGWNINASGNAEFANLDVRGAIRSSVFLYNQLLASSGTLGVFKAACKLKSDAAVPSSPTYGTTTINIDCVDQDGVTHAASQLFVANDILRLKDGLTGDTWFKVSSTSDQTTFWRYVAIIMAGSNNVTYRAGAGVADYGVSGKGFIIQTADQTNAPYLQMATHPATFTSQDSAGTLNVTPQLRLGNLNGSYGYASDVYGLGAGQYGTASKAWFTIEQTNGLRMGSNTTTRMNLALDGSGYLANSNFSWDTSGNVSILGNATIAGWTVSASRLYSTNLYLDQVGQYLSIGAIPPQSYLGDSGIWQGIVSSTPKLSIGTVTPSFTTSTVSGLKIWLKADALSLNDGDAVTTWTDSSGNSWSPTQATGSKKPTFRKNVLNGKSVVRFDGTDDVLSLTQTLTWGTVIAVLKYRTSGNFPDYDGAVITNAGATDGDIWIAGNNASSSLYNGGHTHYVNQTNTHSFSPIDTFKIVAAKITAASKTSFAIGQDPAGGTRYWDGDIAEVLVFDTQLSDAERGLVETYLAYKYAITISSYSYAQETLLSNGLAWDGTTLNIKGNIAGGNFTGLVNLSGASAAIAIGSTPPTGPGAGTGGWMDKTGLYGIASSILQAKFDFATGAFQDGLNRARLDRKGLTITNEGWTGDDQPSGESLNGDTSNGAAGITLIAYLRQSPEIYYSVHASHDGSTVDTQVEFLEQVGGGTAANGSAGSWYLSSRTGGSGAWVNRLAVQAAGTTAAGHLKSSSATGGVGYGTGAGGSVTQVTSKTTGVTLNTVSGAITMHNAALAGGAKVSFVVTDSAVATTDGIHVWIASGGTANAYRADVTAVGSGSFTITVENITGGSLSEAPVIGFAVFKAVTN